MKSVLEAILVYWMHFWIPVGILERIRKIYSNSYGMIINEDKSSFYYSGMEESELISIQNIFSFNVNKIESGMKYLGFHLKPCRYLLKYWDWLISKVE